jgi:hypothetical protein
MKLHTIFKSLDISNRITCPYTHQQNISIERKNQNIVEIGLTLT